MEGGGGGGGDSLCASVCVCGGGEEVVQCEHQNGVCPGKSVPLCNRLSMLCLKLVFMFLVV